MTLDELKERYGPEYPAIALVDGQPVMLSWESQFTRAYEFEQEGQKHQYRISRFMDRSASITLDQLRQEWPAWSSTQRLEFCNASAWLNEQSDFADILRFIMEHGSPSNWSAIALSVAAKLPCDDAYDLLLRALDSVELSRACNFVQALAYTKHPAAQTRLRTHLSALWNHPDLWKDDPFTNQLAYGATVCIEHLIELGAPPTDFNDHIHKLATHPCGGNRESCRRLAPHYPRLAPDSQNANPSAIS